MRYIISCPGNFAQAEGKFFKVEYMPSISTLFSAVAKAPQSEALSFRPVGMVELVRLLQASQLVLPHNSQLAADLLYLADQTRGARDLACLDMSAFFGQCEYVVSDLVAEFQAGTALSFVQEQLAGQIFPVSSAYASLSLLELFRLGDGGVLETGYGALRSNLLGLSFLDGDGRLVKGGGRVVKNVTGYDVTKLFVGNHFFGLPLTYFLRLFAKPQTRRFFLLHTRSKQQQAKTLLDFAAKALSSGIAFSALELVSQDENCALAMSFDGPGSYVDELGAKVLTLAPPDLPVQASGLSEETFFADYDSPWLDRLDLFCSLKLAAKFIEALASCALPFRYRPAHGRLTISLAGLLSSHSVKNGALELFSSIDQILGALFTVFNKDRQNEREVGSSIYSFDRFVFQLRLSGLLLFSSDQGADSYYFGRLKEALDPRARFGVFDSIYRGN
ncbi:MAG: hypothetical protein LCH63_07040 [Candidatus Melainabacteria bacterium]|nr:hypothetical protein [Candidatus Melainabacteria bacterium]